LLPLSVIWVGGVRSGAVAQVGSPPGASLLLGFA